MSLEDIIGIALAAVAVLWVPHLVSYHWLKGSILRRHRWDLNVCCGTTDGGGVNADIVAHAPLPKFVKVDVYRLPFGDRQFDRVLCSHTLEHVGDPRQFYEELQRVGGEVTVVLPPLWDVTAALNVLEHRWIFLTLKKEHSTLPPYVRLPLANWIQDVLGQRIHA
jgi:SAM-dependent methyltransferase